MSPNLDLHIVGASHRTAPLDVLERIAVPRQEVATRLARVAIAPAGRVGRDPDRRPEVLLLSTCNRTECWVASREGPAVARRVWDVTVGVSAGGGLYHLRGEHAVRHVLRVATGLDSSILGDGGILGQIRDAVAAAGEAGTLGEAVSHAVGLALSTGRTARQRTDIAWGAAGVESAALGVLSDRRGRLHDLRSLVIGAGDVGSAIARGLTKRGATVLVANRTDEKARAVARDLDAGWVPWRDLGAAIASCDLAVVAVSSRQPVVTRRLLDGHLGLRRHPLLVVDVSLPRSVEPSPAVELVTLDGIEERRTEVLERRTAAIPFADQLVEEQVTAWKRWCAARPIEDAVKQLHLDAAEMSRRAAHELVTDEHPSNLSAGDAQLVIHRSMKALLHRHTERLRELAPNLTQIGAQEAT